MKRGFTLVELVAVVVLLGLLVTFVYSRISNIAEKKSKILDNKKMLVINAAKEYIDDNDVDSNIGDIYCISIDELEDENLVPVEIDDLKEKYNFVKVIFGSKNSYNFVNSINKESCEAK